MKLNKLFLGAIAVLASAAMVACSDDAPDNPGVDVPKDGGYIAVNIVAPSGAASRAETDDPVFSAGNEDENTISSILFLLFKSNGDAFGDPIDGVKKDPSTTQTPGTDVNIEKVTSAVMVIKASAGSDVPAKFLTIINAPEGFSTTVKGKSLSDVRAIAANYENAKKGSFMMSNSIYMNGTTEESTTPINQLYNSETEAANNAVNVYVERVVAKIVAKKSTTFTDDISVNLHATANGEATSTTLYPVISGYTLANKINKSYVIKDITNNATWTTEWAGWNAHAANNLIYRSYWAKSYNGDDVAYNNQTWTDISGDDAVNFSDDVSEIRFYTQENTTQDATKQTAFLATVTLYSDEAHTTTQSFIKFGPNYYHPSAFSTLMANILKVEGYRIKNGNTISTIPETNIALITTPSDKKASITATGITDAKEFESWAQLSGNITGTFVKYKGTGSLDDSNSYGDTDETAINTFLAQKQNRCKYWRDGKAYYYVSIKHFGNPKTGTMTNDYSKGVVRNHLYSLTLNGISGFGTPVFDPDEVIIPTNPGEEDNFYFLAAKINILSWKIVTQSVDFN